MAMDATLTPRQFVTLMLAAVRPLGTAPPAGELLTFYAVNIGLRYGNKVLDGSWRYLLSRLPECETVEEAVDARLPVAPDGCPRNTLAATLRLFRAHEHGHEAASRAEWVARRREVAAERLLRCVDGMERWQDAIDLTVCALFLAHDPFTAREVARVFCERIANPPGARCRVGVLTALLPHVAAAGAVDLRPFLDASPAAFEPTDALFLGALSAALCEPASLVRERAFDQLAALHARRPTLAPLAAFQVLLRLGALPYTDVQNVAREMVERIESGEPAWLRVRRADLRAVIACSRPYDYGTPLAHVLRRRQERDEAAGARAAELDLGPLFLAALRGLLGIGGQMRRAGWEREDVRLLQALPLQWALCHRASTVLRPIFCDGGQRENDAAVERIDALARLAESVPLEPRFAALFAEWFERRWRVRDALRTPSRRRRRRSP